MRIAGAIEARKDLGGELGAGVYIQSEGFGENSFGGLGHGSDTTVIDAREQERERARLARDRLARRRQRGQTTRPPAMAVTTLTSRIFSGGMRKMSSLRMTRSASLPGARVPFTSSWNSA